ncbi:MAG: transposase [Candidatus Margulisiibacteriota bacterium]|nr:transposase [Candidatus Margulisiibacteriota bacterium]
MARRKWTAEEKMPVVRAMLQKDRPVTQICKSYGISDAQAYKWRWKPRGYQKAVIITRTRLWKILRLQSWQW